MATVRRAAGLTGEDLMMDRRAAMKTLAAAAVATGSAMLEPLESWLLPLQLQADDSLRRRGKLELRDVEHLEQVAQAFHRWGRQFRGVPRFKGVVGMLNEVADILKDHQAPAVEKGLYRVMASLAVCEGP
jgi:hypothetical protein